MVQTCTKCSRANPADAVYCYFDGFVLHGHSRNGGPVAIGSQTFNSPFVFPTGRSCRSFDELALACQEDWGDARNLLQKGYLENFLGGIGRVDLALAAREAGKFPDPDRGLDQLLAKLPSDVLGEPQLRVEPQEFSLGVIRDSGERTFDLHLENQGMRLLYGTVSCADSVWLTLGDAPGATQKHVQFNHELTIPVRVHGDRVRASSKPVEARLLVETNGGTSTVIVRAERPVKPFPTGVLAGAKSPRQVAEKAKANPKKAAPLFEKGAIAEWYKDNGWTYPVRGPSASGIGGIQQFFEALGLTPPPKVEISEKAVALSGNVGEQLRHALEVKTQEKRPVYAHATSNQPWLEVGRPKLSGRVATISFSIPSVPDRPGETLTASLTIQSNGNQRFVVPVTLQVGGDFNFAAPVAVPPPVPLAEIKAPSPTTAAPPVAVILPSKVEPSRPRARSVKKPSAPAWMHLMPALLLFLALLGVVIWDLATKGPKAVTEEGPHFEDDAPRKGVSGWTYHLEDRDPRLGVEFSPESQRFGVLMLKEKDPEEPGKYKRLTYAANGESNNTCVLIDGADYLYGQPPGYWVPRGRPRRKLADPNRVGWESVMRYPENNVQITQHVELLPGAQSHVLDTVLIWYTVKNASTVGHTVGLRVMLDTYIGANDGVPFVIPGRPGLFTGFKEFSEKEIPDYVEALEKPDVNNPGTVAHLSLKGLHLPGVELEPIHSMIIGRFPGNTLRWELPAEERKPIGKDSCVLLYWRPEKMRAGEARQMAFTYGLGKIAVEGGDTAPAGATQVGLSAGGDFRPGKTFTVTAYVKNAKEGQKVKLELPDGLSLEDGEEPEKAAEPGDKYSQVSWRVRSSKAGAYTIRATSAGKQASKKIEVRAAGIFG